MNVQTKILVSIAGAAAAWVGTKALTASWKAVTGNDAPDKPEDTDRGATEAIVFAALSGAFIGLLRALATRGATKYIESRPVRATPTGTNRPV